MLVNYNGSRERAEALAAEIVQNGGRAAAIRANVSDAAEVVRLFEETLKEFGRIDILVNNAGITKDNLILKMSEEEFDAVVDTNMRGAFLCMKQAAKLMLKQRSGRIINISSISGIVGNPGQVNARDDKGACQGAWLARDHG